MKAKFCVEHPWVGGTKVCSRDLDHMTKMAATPIYGNQRTIGPENAHLKPDLEVLSHFEMTLTLNTHTPLLTS